MRCVTCTKACAVCPAVFGQAERMNKYLSLFVGLACIHIPSAKPYLSPASLSCLDAEVLWTANSNSQPYAVNLILESGPCLKLICAVSAKAAGGIN